MASTVAGAPRFERTSVERVESPMAESPPRVISLQALHKRSSPLNLTHQHLSHGLLVCGDGLVVFFESKAYLAAGFSKMFFLSPSS
eukprot:symbB.v1.2.008770.t1/scaffold549.1/size255684/11